MELRRVMADSSCALAISFGNLQWLRDRYTIASSPTVINSRHGKAVRLDGTDDKITIGAIDGTIKTVVMKVYLATTTEQLLDFDSGTNYLDATSGTLAVASCADEVLYVDGSATATITTGWHTVAFTTATGITVSNLQVGTDNTNFGQIDVAELSLFTRALSTTEISDIHEDKVFDHINSLVYWNDCSTFGTQPNLAPATYGTLNGTTTGIDATNIVRGVSGMATQYNGTNELTTVAYNANANNIFGGGGSISAWVNPYSDGENNLGYVVMKTAEYLFFVQSEAAGKVEIAFYHYFSGTDGYWSSTSTELVLRTMSHICVSYDNTAVGNDPIIYVNGSPVALTEDQTPTDTADSGTGDIIIGNNPKEGRTWDGVIDEVMIFNTALTQLQAADIYQRQLTGRW